MYQIFVDDTLIYDESSNDIRLKITDGKLTLEDNSAGSLEFTIPSINVGYGMVRRMRSHVVVKRDGEKIWGGRVLSQTVDFDKNFTTFCEGELAYLNDTYQPLQEYNDMTLRQFMEALLLVHNSKCNGDTYNPSMHMDKRIYIGTVTVTDPVEIDKRATNYESTMDIMSSIIDSYGGHMLIRTAYENGEEKLYLDYFKDFPDRTTQTIEFAKNLLDYSRNYDLSEIATVILPLGARKETADMVGDEVSVHWNWQSIISADGKVRLGKYFHTTSFVAIDKESTWNEYDSEHDRTTEKSSANKLYLTMEQVDGFIMYYFYDSSQRPIGNSYKTASGSNSAGYERLLNEEVSIPNDAKYVRFGYYIDEFTTCEFEARYVTHWGTTTYGHDNYRYGNIQIVSTKIIDTLGAVVASLDIRYSVTDPIYVSEDQIFYASLRQNNGYGMYCAYGADGRVLSSVETATTGTGYTDWTNQKLEAFPSGTKYFRLGAMRRVGLTPKLNMDQKSSPDYYNPPDEYVTIESVNNDSLYLKDNTLIAQYGWIEKTVNFDDAKTPQELYDAAEEYMSYQLYGSIVLQVSAFDLHIIDSTIESINILDTVRCRSDPHDVNALLPVTKLEISLLSPESTRLTLGSESAEVKSLTGSNAQSDLEIFSRLQSMPEPSSILMSAKANATSLINQPTNGFVQATPNEMLVMDAPEKDDATRVWRWNINGLGYSSTGYEGPFGTAITMDGAIVADRITTGFMHADRIRGGTLTLGGYDNVNGEFYMKNAEGRTFVKMTKDGSEIMGSVSQPLMWKSTMNATVDPVTGVLTNITPEYGLIEFANGAINGYKAEIVAEVANSTEATMRDWWKHYTFSFDDISDVSLKTALYLLRSPDKDASVETYGISMYSAEYFSLWLCEPESTKNRFAPHIELGGAGSQSSMIFTGGGSTFVGIYYDDCNLYNDFSDDSYYGTSDSSLTNRSNIHERTLVIRNDNSPNIPVNYGVEDRIGHGGLNLMALNTMISLESRDLYLKSDSLRIIKNNTGYIAPSNSITFPVNMQMESDGRVSHFDYCTIQIVNGIICNITTSSNNGQGDFGSG